MGEDNFYEGDTEYSSTIKKKSEIKLKKQAF